MAAAPDLPAASLPLPGGQTNATVKVHPLRIAEIRMPPDYIAPPAGPLSRARGLGLLAPPWRWYWAPIPAFLVEHPQAGPFLVDTGLHSSVARDPRQSLGWGGRVIFRVRMTPDDAVPAQLRARGVDPAQVELVVMTHLHFDHASGITEFPRATFVLDPREWEAAHRQGFLHGYRTQHYGENLDWRGLSYEAGAEPFGPFEHSLDLFGDGSVRLVSTRGHTLGHHSLVLRLADRSCLLTGDAAYARRTIDESLVPPLFEDEALYRDSLRRIQGYVREHPDAVVIPGHDPETWATLAAVYE
jgi:glyoxylase-like metal-dependent hydrolase (beta-lactamase superfamily II)